jgi:hypothetical protein
MLLLQLLLAAAATLDQGNRTEHNMAKKSIVYHVYNLSAGP